MSSRLITLSAILALGLFHGTSATGAEPAPAGPVRFNRDIRPILSDQCFACHGFDSKKRKAGLRLDVAEGAYAVNKEGRVAVKPGSPDQSELWKRLLTTDADDVMPPPDTHKSVSDEQKALIRRWIEQGAPYEKHWSFEPPHAVAVPQDPEGSSNPIDRFLRERLRSAGLPHSPEADRPTLIRRLSFDLRGLPPTPEEVAAFLSDSAPGAYERLVDRFLASPRYGEQMARHWLDVARYADTHGLHLDNERQIWPYRDWVVTAFNRNLPFDRFTVEQLAGDLLPNPTQDQLVATGFNRNNVTTSEGGAIDAEFVFRYAVDRTSTTVQAWMGLTAGCAVCHDHKFDPISQKEFYSMYAFFHSAADPAMDGNALRTPPLVQLKTPEDEARLAEMDRKITEAEARIRSRVETVAYSDPALANPVPAPKVVEQVWFDDDLPAGARPQMKPKWVNAAEGPVKSGRLSIRQQSGGLWQDVFENVSVDVPTGATVFADVFLDPANPPKLIMLQFFQGSWEHRVVWGDADATTWGEKGSPSRQVAGALPKSGEWVHLEFEASRLGLKPGEKVTGLAYTEVGGTVHWDRAGVLAKVDPANDPTTSFTVWLRENSAKESKELPEDLRKALKAGDGRTPEQVARLRAHYLSKVCSETRPVFEPMHNDVAAIRRQRDQFNDGIPQTFIWRDLEKPRDSFVMLRGQYDKPGEKVTRDTPAAFPKLRPSGDLPNRLDLARWLVSGEHPLTARVTVNRFWQQFFGVGLVKTADDFGSQGEPPSHPELLDWLSLDFIGSGWDVRNLVRRMVTSAAYRQTSRATPEMVQRDPENRLLARGPRFRLDAEQLRDNALFVSGLLDGTLGGKGVRPYQPPNIWEPVGYGGSNTRFYKADSGSGLYRRSLYTFFKRTAPAPFMSTFDAPNREQFCTRRERSNTPLQALQLLNDVQYFEAARGLASRMLAQGGRTSEDRIRHGFVSVLSRNPEADELARLKGMLETFEAKYRSDRDAATKLVTYGESKPPADLPTDQLAAYTQVANLLLNLDETVSRN